MDLSTYTHKSYDGGLNDTDSPREIDRDEASVLRNWLVREKGKLTQRPGLTAVGDALTGDSCGGLHSFLQNDGDKDVLVMDGANLKYLNSTTFDSLDDNFTEGKPFSFVNVMSTNKVYIENEDNVVHTWDRASVSHDSCLTELAASVPHGNKSIWYKNFMFKLNNVNISGTKYPNNFYWSTLGDPDTYDTTNDKVALPNGGRLITAAPLGEEALIIFQEHAIRFLDGYGNADWRVTATANNMNNIDESIGCIALNGAVGVGDEVWFVDDEANIRRIYQTDFGSFRKDIISTKVQGTLDGINKTQLAKAQAWAHDNYVFFAFPNGSDTVNSIVLVFDIMAAKRLGDAGKKAESWTTITGWNPDFFMAHPTSTTPDLYIADITAGKVFKWYGKDDDGTAIDCRWDHKIDNYDKAERWKRYMFGYTSAESETDEASVGVYASIDGSTFGKMGDLESATTGSRLAPTGTDTLGPTGLFTLGGSAEGSLKFYYQDSGASISGKTVQHSIRHAEVAKAASINGFTSHYKLRSLR